MEEINNWYFNKIPSKKDKKTFSKFLSNAHQLGKKINPKQYIQEYSSGNIRLPEGGKHSAKIPNWIGNDLFNKAQMVALWNTFVLRSCIMSTNKIIFPENVLNSVVSYQTFVDNLYTSKVLDDSVFSPFNRATLNIMYTEDTFNQALAQNNRYMLLEHYFNPIFRTRVREIFGKEVCDLLYWIEGESNAPAREGATRKLYELLESPSENDSAEDKTNQDDQKENINDHDQNKKTVNDLIEEDIGLESKKLEPFIREINAEIHEGRTKLWSLELPYSDVITVINMEEIISRAKTIKDNPAYEGFGRQLHFAVDTIVCPAVPHHSGQDILDDHLENIIIDGCVLGINSTKEEEIPLHVIILADYSESMNRDNLKMKVLQAARHLFYDLRFVGHFVEVWAHTSESTKAYLYKIADNFTTNVDKQFGKLLYQYSGANFDHEIIKYLFYNEFDKCPNYRKALWVLSDGLPRGDNPIAKLREIVQLVRSKNISVTSLSLVPHCVSDNNAIYGKEFNIDASDDFDQAMKTLALLAQKQ